MICVEKARQHYEFHRFLDKLRQHIKINRFSLKKHESITKYLQGRDAMVSFFSAIEENKVDDIESMLKGESTKGLINKCRQKDRSTPLNVATHEQRKKIIKILLKHPDVDVNMADLCGNTPLFHAVKNQSVVTLPDQEASLDVCISAHTREGEPR